MQENATQHEAKLLMSVMLPDSHVRKMLRKTAVDENSGRSTPSVSLLSSVMRVRQVSLKYQLRRMHFLVCIVGKATQHALSVSLTAAISPRS